MSSAAAPVVSPPGLAPPSTRTAGAGPRPRRARGLERMIEGGLLACALVSALTTIGIVVVLAQGALAFFRDVSPLAFLLDTQWTPLFAAPRYGVWPLVAGTLLTSAIALAVALPLGVRSSSEPMLILEIILAS